MWLSVISGDPFAKTTEIINQLQNESKGKNLQQMQKLYDDLSSKYHTFFDSECDFNREIEIEHPKLRKTENNQHGLIEHVVNHDKYHHGNIIAMLRQQGYSGVPNVYIFLCMHMILVVKSKVNSKICISF